ncbi:DUF58 domain-containing protein [Candidatus Venteria ishoeyi]|uniref:DUF58 domain-containing protein n=1 Tax=Candidatus Venteria ishoeyi TaxID=1899563 RepID=A0A1H6F981_9GAMM|nr:DUF58 domain-containing protein [Candidatus Venteria ishoeyi]MDM8545143.1 DUF58 domain-containing protein [Candidatus Venteria ishoeyi]SEH06660.1 Uncharacterised protein [Candidatus Venteria ishoeyi]
MLRRLLFYNFRTVYRVDRWFRQRFTPLGMLIFGVAIAGAVFGIDTRKTFAYQIFAFALALLLLAMFSSLFFRSRFELHRQLPRFGTVGEPVHYQLHIKQHSKAPCLNLVVREEAQTRHLRFSQFQQFKEPGDHYRNRFDRYVGYPRWLIWIRQQRGFSCDWQILPTLLPKQWHKIPLTLYPHRRGFIDLQALIIAKSDSMNLFRALYKNEQKQRLLILPRLYQAPDVQLPGTRKYQPGGVNLAMSVGDAMEFFALREYRPGDPLRNIHWKSWARQGKPIVKEYQDEFFVRHGLILDTFHPEGGGDIFEDAVSVAASFVSNMTTQDTLLDMMLVGDQAYCFTSGRGLQHLDKMLEILACVQPESRKTIKELKPLVTEHANILSGCICILLGWDDARKNLIQCLHALNIPLLGLIICPPDTILEALPADIYVLHSGQIQEDLNHLQRS